MEAVAEDVFCEAKAFFKDIFAADGGGGGEEGGGGEAEKTAHGAAAQEGSR